MCDKHGGGELAPSLAQVVRPVEIVLGAARVVRFLEGS